jgi:pimeloyl-ACP methyl ester carboxylesterase
MQRTYGLTLTLAMLATAGATAGDWVQPRRALATAAKPAALHPCVEFASAGCGQITVPLDRSTPSRGTTVVAFALVPRLDRRRPSLGTLVYNPGGPGAAVIGSMREIARMFAPLGTRRDLLLIDPRGTGRSGPLRCAALEPEYIRPRDLLEHMRVVARFGRCGAELGARANLYGSAAIADDVDDVRAALGLQRLDLVGSSYGT